VFDLVGLDAEDAFPSDARGNAADSAGGAGETLDLAENIAFAFGH
jgi:hypothetical protein